MNETSWITTIDSSVENSTLHTMTFDDITSTISDENYYHEIFYEEDYYETYPFEQVLYMYIWTFLVTVTSLTNVVILCVLLRKRMRNPINCIFVALALSDSLTGLVTLPSYITVFQVYQRTDENSQDFCAITKDQCKFFMLSKFFLSKLFHTISIFLTVLLGCQRFVSVAIPFRSKAILTTRNTAIICIGIFVMSPLLHVYQITEKNSENGICRWSVEEDCRGNQCIYVWIIFVVRHLIPCTIVTTVTVLFIMELKKGEIQFKRTGSSRSQMSIRKTQNNRITRLVIAIATVFLIPEIPYGLFLFARSIRTEMGKPVIDMRINRIVHAVYEISLVLTFQAHFYIYIILSHKFHSELKGIVIHFIQVLSGKHLLRRPPQVSSRSRGRTLNSTSSFLASASTYLPMTAIVNKE